VKNKIHWIDGRIAPGLKILGFEIETVGFVKGPIVILSLEESIMTLGEIGPLKDPPDAAPI